MSRTVTPELTAEQEAQKPGLPGWLEPFIRSALMTGIPAETLARTLCGEPDPQMEESLQNLRDRTLREARVEAGLEVATTLKRLEILWAAMMSEGDHAGALRVVQERARFTRAAEFVRHTTAGDVKRPKSAYELARDKVRPEKREKLNVEYREKIIALAEATRVSEPQVKVTPVRTKAGA